MLTAVEVQINISLQEAQQVNVSLIQIKKIEGRCLWHSLRAVLFFFADPSAKVREGSKKEGEKGFRKIIHQIFKKQL